MMQQWIKVTEEQFSKFMADQNHGQFDMMVFMYLCFNARWKPTKYTHESGVEIGKNQVFITSAAMVEAFKPIMTRDKLTTCLKRLEKYGLITVEVIKIPGSRFPKGQRVTIIDPTGKSVEISRVDGIDPTGDPTGKEDYNRHIIAADNITGKCNGVVNAPAPAAIEKFVYGDEQNIKLTKDEYETFKAAMPGYDADRFISAASNFVGMWCDFNKLTERWENEMHKERYKLTDSKPQETTFDEEQWEDLCSRALERLQERGHSDTKAIGKLMKDIKPRYMSGQLSLDDPDKLAALVIAQADAEGVTI